MMHGLCMCHSKARDLSYRPMRRHSYLIHRASKFGKPSRVELRLIDGDLAAAGVHIYWTHSYDPDASAVIITRRVMNDVLDAA